MNSKKNSILSLFILVLLVGILFYSNKQEKINILEETLADTNSVPKLITPTYNTDHFIVADYIISPSTSDMTSTIQNALNSCKESGGGTVWLENGVYNISSAITIPSSCTLMGDWQDPDNYQGNLEYGSKIVVDVKKYKSDNSNHSKTGLFKLEPSAGIEGLTIYYKNQNIDNPVSQPWTMIYISSSHGMSLLNTIKNITLINSYRGIGQSIDAEAHAVLNIENVKGTVLYDGVFIHRSGDVGTVNNLILKPKYWATANLKAFNDNVKNVSENTISNKIKAINGRGLTITKVDSSQLVNITISGYKYGLLIPSNSNMQDTDAHASASIYNMNISDCSRGIYVESGKKNNTTMLMGYVISNSEINGTEYAIYNDCDESSVQGKDFQGALKLHDVTIKGKIGGKGRTLVFDQTSNSYKTYSQEIDLTGIVNKTNKFSNLNLSRKLKNDGKNFVYLSAGSSVDTINKFLSDISKKGGGVVYLKPGKYNINKTVVIPANVELRGSSASRLHYFDMGTVFNMTYTSNDNHRGVIIVGDNAGISGINFIYKDMLDAINSGTYAAHDYAVVAENIKNVYANNLTIAGATFGIYFNKCNNFTIKNILSYASHNAIRLDSSSNGLIMNTLNNGWVLDMNGLYSFNKGGTDANNMALNNLKYIHLNNSTDIYIQNAFAFRANTTIKAENSKLYGINVGHDDSITGNTKYIENTNSNAVLVNLVKFSHCDTVTNIKGNSIGVYNVISDWNNDNPDISNNIFKIVNEIPTSTTKMGDINSDGIINSQDYILIRKHILKQITLSSNQIISADMNKDNSVTSLDYIIIKKMILNGENK